MDVLYRKTKSLIDELNQTFVRLERCSPNECKSIEEEIQIRIDRITSNNEQLELLTNKELPSRKQNAKLRVDQLKYDCQHYQAALRNFQLKRLNVEQQQRDREELLSRRFTPNDQATSIMIDHALQHSNSLNNAHRGVDELIMSGSNVLNNLRDQRGTLKGVHKKILDIANTLGMSNTVMRLIEKRTYQDKFILFGGMFLTCVIMFLVVKYLT
ncbi:Golgi SNAP receptor complex member 2-like isoform X3 [Centruroides sculpturatus]|uniref:Golgi SNAP receptor complex member 2-like isoform X1 n=1 Tax=Centruroides sculpturatus TaxID=218467 RepID=UPI000C6D6A83|nr:Golgi SNAP receptor complex member 2-like isoform X1 [Centruroides sculpturatus]XP_023224416.1 Golgi SNAP receptor complex member 2-like isoform X2 [Centruroides sculpturatus]XP_023224417.1 Golgi SNAP receptor complex member 2-like isoform X3 [Centruroides sculpturatus]